VSARLYARQVDRIMFINISGPIALGDGTVNVRETLLNLSDLSYIDSAGIGEPIARYAATSHGGRIKLLCLTKHVKNLSQITKLYTIFEIPQCHP
jgi:anti-anti-sigma factor